MKSLKLLLPALLLASCAMPAEAQFFTRKPRLQNMQPPELIATIKTDADERKRTMAIEQLREFDVKTYAEIVPVLIDAMLSDASSGVRMEALHSLTRIRPATPTIGQALQQAAQHDSNFRVRWQARTTMWMHGYHGNDQGVPPAGVTGKEPPLLNNGTVIAAPMAPAPSSQPTVPATAPPGTPIYVPSAPLPDPRPLAPASTVSLPRPLPSRPAGGFSTAVPQQPVQVPATPAGDDGPMIIPAP